MIRFFRVDTREALELPEEAEVTFMPSAWEAYLASDGRLGAYECPAKEIKPGKRCSYQGELLERAL